MSEFKQLIMITPNNNNKFYNMIWDGKSDTFNVEFGRVEATKQTSSYPRSKWNSILKSKLRKGYKDVTEFVATEKVIKDFTDHSDLTVDSFIKLMQKYRDNLINQTYSVKATSVTIAQVEEAQKILNEIESLSKKKKVKDQELNDKLIELYSIIPRRMRDVKLYLLPQVDINQTLSDEQDNIDALSSQIGNVVDLNNDHQNITLLDTIGIKMSPVTDEVKELEYLLEQSSYFSSQSLKNSNIQIFEVNSSKEDSKFEKFVSKLDKKDTRILIHGTRCSSVLSIMEQGLKIRPVGNFSFSGKVYGEGTYMSEVVKKSLNYTGNDKHKILLVYEVAIGNPYVYEGWFTGNDFLLEKNELKKRGFDSVYVKAGNGLLNSEVVLYDEDQYRIKYLINLEI